MKTFKNFIFISLVGFTVSLPFFVMAINPGEVPGADYLSIKPSPVRDVPGLVDVVAQIVKWIYTIFFVVAVIFILFAAFNYLRAADDPEKPKEAKKQIIYAAIAIIVAFLAVGFEVIIRNFLTPGGSQTGGGVQVGQPKFTPLSPGEPGPFGTFPTTPSTGNRPD